MNNDWRHSSLKWPLAGWQAFFLSHATSGLNYQLAMVMVLTRIQMVSQLNEPNELHYSHERWEQLPIAVGATVIVNWSAGG